MYVHNAPPYDLSMQRLTHQTNGGGQRSLHKRMRVHMGLCRYTGSGTELDGGDPNNTYSSIQNTVL